MVAHRVRVAKDKADLVRDLVSSSSNTAPFSTYADVVSFAAALGYQQGKRVPLEGISNTEPSPISLEVFVSRGYDTLLKLLAIVETQKPQVLCTYDHSWEAQRVHIFEEYANGGLEILRERLRGTVDYTERILLLLSATRSQSTSTGTEFDLSRFL